MVPITNVALKALNYKSTMKKPGWDVNDSDASLDVSHQSTFEMSTAVFNSRICAWEPIVEPWHGMARQVSEAAV